MTIDDLFKLDKGKLERLRDQLRTVFRSVFEVQHAMMAYYIHNPSEHYIQSCRLVTDALNNLERADRELNATMTAFTITPKVRR